MIFSVFQKNGFWGILGPPSYGIGATLRIGREMLCLPYAGFFWKQSSEVLLGSRQIYEVLLGIELVKGGIPCEQPSNVRRSSREF